MSLGLLLVYRHSVIEAYTQKYIFFPLNLYVPNAHRKWLKQLYILYIYNIL